MTPPQLAGRNSTLNLPDPGSLQPRMAPNPYMDHAVVLPGVNFQITPGSATEMDHLRHRTFGFPEGGPDALQHSLSPMQLAMGGGEPGDGRQGIELGLTQSAEQPQGKRGMNTSLSTTRPMLGVG
jgi:hypothetical protein